MKSKYLYFLIVMVAGIALAPHVSNAQGVKLRKGINEAGLKRTDNMQHHTLTAIFSQVAPAVGMSETQLLRLYDSGVITLQIAPLGNGAQMISILNMGNLIGNVTVGCITCGGAPVGPILSVPTTNGGVRF